jgi:hypothetical protein
VSFSKLLPQLFKNVLPETPGGTSHQNAKGGRKGLVAFEFCQKIRVENGGNGSKHFIEFLDEVRPIAFRVITSGGENARLTNP